MSLSGGGSDIVVDNQNVNIPDININGNINAGGVTSSGAVTAGGAVEATGNVTISQVDIAVSTLTSTGSVTQSGNITQTVTNQSVTVNGLTADLGSGTEITAGTFIGNLTGNATSADHADSADSATLASNAIRCTAVGGSANSGLADRADEVKMIQNNTADAAYPVTFTTSPTTGTYSSPRFDTGFTYNPLVGELLLSGDGVDNLNFPGLKIKELVNNDELQVFVDTQSG